LHGSLDVKKGIALFDEWITERMRMRAVPLAVTFSILMDLIQG